MYKGGRQYLLASPRQYESNVSESLGQHYCEWPNQNNFTIVSVCLFPLLLNKNDKYLLLLMVVPPALQGDGGSGRMPLAGRKHFSILLA